MIKFYSHSLKLLFLIPFFLVPILACVVHFNYFHLKIRVNNLNLLANPDKTESKLPDVFPPGYGRTDVFKTNLKQWLAKKDNKTNIEEILHWLLDQNEGQLLKLPAEYEKIDKLFSPSDPLFYSNQKQHKYSNGYLSWIANQIFSLLKQKVKGKGVNGKWEFSYNELEIFFPYSKIPNWDFNLEFLLFWIKLTKTPSSDKKTKIINKRLIKYYLLGFWLQKLDIQFIFYQIYNYVESVEAFKFFLSSLFPNLLAITAFDLQRNLDKGVYPLPKYCFLTLKSSQLIAKITPQMMNLINLTGEQIINSYTKYQRYQDANSKQVVSLFISLFSTSLVGSFTLSLFWDWFANKTKKLLSKVNWY